MELKKYPWFKKILEMKYLELFLHYYNDEQPLKELTLFNEKVILSEEITSLIEKGLDYYLYIKFICLYLIKLILTILINN